MQTTTPTTTAPVSKPDILVNNTGSMFTFTPQTADGFAALEDIGESWQYFGISLAVDSRLAEGFAEYLQEQGLTLK